MQTVARLAWERSRHERRFDAVVPGNGLDDPLQQDPVVGGLEGVVAMAQVDFVLGRRELGADSAGGNALDVTGCDDVGEQVVVVVEFGHAIDLDAVLSATGPGADRHLRRTAVGAPWVDQIELELDGTDRTQALGAEPVENTGHDVAWIADEGCAVLLELPQHDLGGGPLGPGHGNQRAGNGQGDMIGVAVGETTAARVFGVACYVIEKGGAGELQALAKELAEFMAPEPLAAQHAAQVRQERVDGFDVRMAGEKCLGVIRVNPVVHSPYRPISRSNAMARHHVQ